MSNLSFRDELQYDNNNTYLQWTPQTNLNNIHNIYIYNTLSFKMFKFYDLILMNLTRLYCIGIL